MRLRVGCWCCSVFVVITRAKFVDCWLLDCSGGACLGDGCLTCGGGGGGDGFLYFSLFIFSLFFRLRLTWCVFPVGPVTWGESLEQ